MKFLPKIKSSDIVVQDLKDEVLIYDLKENKAFCLNETSKFIWQMCNGKNTVADIADKLTKHFKKDVSEDIVYLAITQFEKDGLLANKSEEFADHFGGMSRREVIRKVGFASVIALPIISSIVAPNAAAAASGTCITGVCIAAGPQVCSTCVGNQINVTFYNSNDGTCSGGVLLNFPFTCSAPSAGSSGFDYIINSSSPL